MAIHRLAESASLWRLFMFIRRERVESESLAVLARIARPPSAIEGHI